MPTITVSAMSSGETLVLEASASTTIGELKVIMQAEHGGGLPSAQRFVLGGEALDDALTVEEAGVEEESVLSWITAYVAETITITVNATSLQRTLELEIPVTMTVLQLKGLMSREYGGGPASGQRFVLAGEVLPDRACLEEEGVEEQSVLVWLMIIMDDSGASGSDDIIVNVFITGETSGTAAMKITVQLDWEVSFALARIADAHPRLDPAHVASMTMSIEGETLDNDSLLDEFDLDAGGVVDITGPTCDAADATGTDANVLQELGRQEQASSSSFLAPLKLSRYVATFDEMEIFGSADDIDSLMSLSVADFVTDFRMIKIHAMKLRKWLNHREGAEAPPEGEPPRCLTRRFSSHDAVSAAQIISARGANAWDFFLSHYQAESGDIVALVRL